MAHVEIDGAMGEGGGQVLRSSLTLSVLTGSPLHIRNIRRYRRRPGLQPQHLSAARAAAQICGAKAGGMEQGSQDLDFEPGALIPGRYDFNIGTAGATSLVLQTVYLPLALARQSSEVSIHGGTHVPLSPCYHYLDRQWRPMLARLGIYLKLKMERAGFWPPGGGLMRASIAPCEVPRGLELSVRGDLLAVEGISAAAKLPAHVAERQRTRALKCLRDAGLTADIGLEHLEASSPGSMLLIVLRFRHSQACFFALGARRKRAERVAEEAVAEALRFLATDGAVDPFLADQLLLPLALASAPSEIRTALITPHLTTNAEVVRRFLPSVNIIIQGNIGQPGAIHVDPTR